MGHRRSMEEEEERIRADTIDAAIDMVVFYGSIDAAIDRALSMRALGEIGGDYFTDQHLVLLAARMRAEDRAARTRQ
jgi:hypothetical protein